MQDLVYVTKSVFMVCLRMLLFPVVRLLMMVFSRLVVFWVECGTRNLPLLALSLRGIGPTGQLD